MYVEKEYARACQEAIDEQITVELYIGRMNFAGLPRSGKTSTLRRLIGEIHNIITAHLDKEEPSTGVAERKQIFIQSISKSFGFVSQGQWSRKDIVGETGILNEVIYQSAKGRFASKSHLTLV